MKLRKQRKLISTKYVDDKGQDRYKVKEIKLTDVKKNKFQLFKEFINKIKIGQSFTRKELFHAVYSESVASTLLQGENTIDHYRLCSTLIGFLENSGVRGIYIKKKDIPVNVTSTILKKYASKKDWSTWFTPIEKA